MRVGIVGAGTMGTVHAAAWATTGADLVGVVAKNRATAQPLAEALGVTAYEDYQDLLATVDIVDVCAPSDLHKELVLQAVEAGKHVVCEKPIALTVEDGEAMIEACEQAGVRLFVGMVVRFFPQYLAAQRVVAADKIGDLGVMRLKRVSYQPIGDEGWFADEARSGGLLLDIMIHDLDYARWPRWRGAACLRPLDPGRRGRCCRRLRPGHPSLRQRRYGPRRGGLGLPAGCVQDQFRYRRQHRGPRMAQRRQRTGEDLPQGLRRPRRPGWAYPPAPSPTIPSRSSCSTPITASCTMSPSR